MLMLAAAGLKPCETTNGSNGNSACHSLCTNPTDGYDAVFDGPFCTPCATKRSANQETVEGHNV